MYVPLHCVAVSQAVSADYRLSSSRAARTDEFDVRATSDEVSEPATQAGADVAEYVIYFNQQGLVTTPTSGSANVGDWRMRSSTR